MCYIFSPPKITLLCKGRANETVEKPNFAERSDLPGVRTARFRAVFRGQMPSYRGIRPPGGYWSAPNTQIFPILCTIAYNLHCTSTFALLRRVNRFIRFWAQMFAKTGSTIPSRRA